MKYSIKYNELSAEEFILLWETVWGQAPSLERNRQIILKNPCEFVLAGISTYVSNFNFALLWCIPRQ